MIHLHSVDLWQQAAVVINAVIAAVLGSLIGWERDRAGKSAGPRTMALVCASSAVIVAIGAAVGAEAQFGDPTRALHAVVTGIGFLGAGLIFTNRCRTYLHKHTCRLIRNWWRHNGSNCIHNCNCWHRCGVGLSSSFSWFNTSYLGYLAINASN